MLHRWYVMEGIYRFLLLVEFASKPRVTVAYVFDHVSDSVVKSRT